MAKLALGVCCCWQASSAGTSCHPSDTCSLAWSGASLQLPASFPRVTWSAVCRQAMRTLTAGLWHSCLCLLGCAVAAARRSLKANAQDFCPPAALLGSWPATLDMTSVCCLQVGNVDTDHSQWTRPEDMVGARPSFDVTPSAPGAVGLASHLAFHPRSLAPCSLPFHFIITLRGGLTLGG